MSVRRIWISAFSTGLPSCPFTIPSIVVICANAETARNAIPAAATPRLRNFIEKPPTGPLSVNSQYTSEQPVRTRFGFATAAALLLEQLPLILRPGLLPLQRAPHHP